MALIVSCVALAGAGLTSSISPCTLPLVPGYVGALSDTGSGPKRTRVMLFAAGAAMSFIALGAIIGALGFTIGSSASTISRLAGVALILLSIGLIGGQLGWITLQFHAVRRLPASAGWRSLVLGIGCGAAWTPCVGPLLGAALTAAGGSGSTYRGAILLAAYAVGVLTPFLVLAAVPMPRIGERVRSVGRALPWVAAAMMLLLGVALTTGWYQQAIRSVTV